MKDIKEIENLGTCLRCGMKPLDFYGHGNKKLMGILCDFEIDNGAHLFEEGCTCTKWPHAAPCAFYRPKSHSIDVDGNCNMGCC